MSEKVLKSPSGVGHVIGIKESILSAARRATVRDTPNARCVLQGGNTASSFRIDNPQVMRITSVLRSPDGMPPKGPRYRNAGRNTGIPNTVLPVSPSKRRRHEANIIEID